MPELLGCLHCGKQLAARGQSAGAALRCGCGNVTIVPGVSLPARRLSAGKVLALVLVAAAIPCLAGTLVVRGIGIPHLAAFHEREPDAETMGEARVNLPMLCTKVAAYHDDTGLWLAAGPTPAEPPRAAIVFPVSPAFEKLGFAPRRVRFQYEVRVDGDPRAHPSVRCIARGAIVQSGKVTTATVPLDGDGRPGPIEWSGDPRPFP